MKSANLSEKSASKAPPDVSLQGASLAADKAIFQVESVTGVTSTFPIPLTDAFKGQMATNDPLSCGKADAGLADAEAPEQKHLTPVAAASQLLT